MSNVFLHDMICPKCRDSCFDASYLDKKLYVCRHKDLDGRRCDYVQAYCKKCEKIYTQEDFGLHGDVWECKECGSVCWPLTDYRRFQAATHAKFSRLMQSSSAFLDALDD